MERIKIIWADSRGKTIVVLLILIFVTFCFQFRVAFVWHILISFVLSVCFDSFLLWYRFKKPVVSLSSIITGLLIGLIFDPLSGFLPTAVACLLASLSKNFIGKSSHRHVFNPAAFGIVLSSMISNRSVAWWGASWGMIPVVIIAIGTLPLLWKLRRFWMPLTFLAVYFISIQRIMFDGTVFLFTFIMLTEPKTSPMQGKWQWGWGILVGILVLVQNLLGLAIADPMLLALLVANLFGYIFIR